jgi:peptide/nickel transport system permease protein
MRVSLTIGLLSVAISITLGVLAGLLAGYMGGATDFVITRLLEVLICFPPFFLILTISIFLEQMTLVHIFLLIGLTSWPQVARLVRNEVLKVKNSDFILAARSQGIPKRQILLYHLLPNTFPPVLVTATFGIATAIMIEAALSFAGLGDPLLPSWGELLNNGRIEGKLWLVLPPGLCLFFLVSLCNLLGEALRRHFNPRNEEA